MSRWTDFRSLFGRDPRRDVDEELSYHIELLERRLIERGETPERARELSRRQFGDYSAAREECVTIDERQVRRAGRAQYLAELSQDIGYATRSLLRSPGFMIVAILTLALGIGANSAIFSVVHGVLLDSLPYRNADRLHVVHMKYPDGGLYSALSAPDFMSVAEDNRVFDAVVAYEGMTVTVSGLGEPRESRAALVSRDLINVFGLRLQTGRSFTPDEHVPGEGRVVIASHGFWQRELGGTDALGRTFTINGNPYTVVGVLAEGVALPGTHDLLVPLDYDATFDATTATGRRSEFLFTVGVARAGVDADAVAADLARLGADLAERFPATNERLSLASRPLRDVILGDVGRPLLILLGAVGLVLLVACANVANLLLARASTRRGELAVRTALGAGRGRLLRQLLTESLVLSMLGGIAGLAVAWAGTRALVNAQPADIPRLQNIGLDGTVIAVTMGVALLTGLLFGAVPALQATGKHLNASIRAGGRGNSGGGNRLRSGLIIAEMALAVVLLVGSGLLIRSFVQLTRVDPGFQPENAVSVRIMMTGQSYSGGEQIRRFVDDVITRMEAVPGVTAVGGTSVLPLSGRGGLWNFAVVNAPPPPDDVNAEISVTSVTPGYFEAAGVPMLRGRGTSQQDHNEAPPVVVLNEAAARFWFPGEDPIGRFVAMDQDREVVGIVQNILQRSPSEAALPAAYVPHAQMTTRTLRLVVRGSTDPMVLGPAIRNVIREADPGLPLSEVVPLHDVVRQSVARPRFYTALLTLFAGVALALAAVGIFGVMSFSVAQRSREISIRMALGARTTEVAGMVVRRSMLLAAAGLLLGIAGALAVGRLLASQLYNVNPTDPLTMAGVALVLLATALAASWIPARRAAGMAPGEVLRGG